jgi:hypothetical protein
VRILTDQLSIPLSHLIFILFLAQVEVFFAARVIRLAFKPTVLVAVAIIPVLTGAAGLSTVYMYSCAVRRQ